MTAENKKTNKILASMGEDIKKLSQPTTIERRQVTRLIETCTEERVVVPDEDDQSEAYYDREQGLEPDIAQMPSLFELKIDESKLRSLLNLKSAITAKNYRSHIKAF